MGYKMLFELHAELGVCDDGEHYLKLYLDDGTEFVNKTSYVTDAISSTGYRLGQSGLMDDLYHGRVKSIWNRIKGPQPVNIKMPKNGSKLKPSDLTKVNPPDCTPICTSYEFFGKSKCKGMCAAKFQGT